MNPNELTDTMYATAAKIRGNFDSFLNTMASGSFCVAAGVWTAGGITQAERSLILEEEKYIFVITIIIISHILIMLIYAGKVCIFTRTSAVT